MFIVSKRNFLVRRADGSTHLIEKDYVGPISDEDFKSPIVQMAIEGGVIAVSERSADKQLEKAVEAADEVETDIRPDAGEKKKPEK